MIKSFRFRILVIERFIESERCWEGEADFSRPIRWKNDFLRSAGAICAARGPPAKMLLGCGLAKTFLGMFGLRKLLLGFSFCSLNGLFY